MTHGGLRPNAGRPNAPEPLKPRTVQMSDEQYARAERIGCGNASRGVRLAVEGYKRAVTLLPQDSGEDMR
jgi:hypothetical protein